MTIKVDLLPTEKKSFGIDPAMIVMFMLIIGAAVAMLLYSQSLDTKIEEHKAQIETVNQEIKQIETQLPLIDETKKRIVSLKREIKMIKSLVHDPLRYANLLQEVAVRLPENVWIKDLTISPQNNTVKFSGSAAEVFGERKPLATIADMMRNFNESEYFTNSTLASTSETANPLNGEPSVFDFSLTITYDPDKAAGSDTATPGTGATPAVEEEAATAPGAPVTGTPTPNVTATATP